MRHPARLHAQWGGVKISKIDNLPPEYVLALKPNLNGAIFTDPKIGVVNFFGCTCVNILGCISLKNMLRDCRRNMGGGESREMNI